MDYLNSQTPKLVVIQRSWRNLETFRMNSFCVRTTNKWNSLPNDTVNSKNVLSFKTLYDRHIYNWRDLLANLLVSINIAYWTSTVRFYMYDNITTALLRRTTTCRKLYVFTKANRPLNWKKKKKKKKYKKTTTAPPPPPTQKYSALPSTPHPIIFHLEQLSTVVFWCARIHVQFI